MAYPDELLDQAFELIEKETSTPKQADLRRGVSSAYYALFHLLIQETVSYWSQEESRAGLARMFEHRVMAKVSDRVRDPRLTPFGDIDALRVADLRFVAESFVLLQEARHIADYDSAKIWTRTDALGEVMRAKKAFAAWNAIRQEKIAQDYLVSLLIKPRA